MMHTSTIYNVTPTVSVVYDRSNVFYIGRKIKVFSGNTDLDQLQRHILLSGQRAMRSNVDDLSEENGPSYGTRRRESNLAINNPNVNNSTNV